MLLCTVVWCKFCDNTCCRFIFHFISDQPQIKLFLPLNANHSGDDITGRGNNATFTGALEYSAGPRGGANGSIHVKGM